MPRNASDQGFMRPSPGTESEINAAEQAVEVPLYLNQ